MNIPYLLTCARDWQRIKQAYALDHAGTADGNQALVDSRRIGELADAVQHLDSALRLMIRVHCVDDDEYDTELATDRIYRLTLMISAARSMLAGGEAPKDTVDHLPDRSAANRLRAVLETISELAAWHADDEADPANPSPEDQVAHINGLIRRACADALSNTEDGAPEED